MITLAEAKVGMADKVDQAVIDEFRRGSLLLDSLMFDNAVSPGTAGSTLTYGYMKLETPSTASFRKLNEEYTGSEAKRKKASADLKIFGGEFGLDRVIIDTSGAVDELDFQMKEKIKAAINLFHYAVINGNSIRNKDEFDGLNKLVTGSSTEFNKGEVIDLSTSAKMDENYSMFLDMMDSFISTMQGKPTMLLMNSKMKTKLKGIARRAGYYSRTEDAFGRSIDNWDGIPFVDLEEYFNGTKTLPCVPIDESAGTTDIYAVQIAKDGFHGVSPLGNNLISTHLPDLKAPGVIKKGDVEMVAAVVLKNTLKAGVFRDIKVAAGTTGE
ncbi:MAG: phage capsid protein [Erysipelotrichaceae bacterium]|nr:phage capsid protein [Erysipelotrichaceae bacterium]